MSAVTWGHEPLVQVRGPLKPRATVRAARRAQRAAAQAAGLVMERPAVRAVAPAAPPVVPPAAQVVVMGPAQRVVAPQRPRVVAPQLPRVVAPGPRQVVAGPAARLAAGTAASRAGSGASEIGARAPRAGVLHGRAAAAPRTAPSMHLTARGRVALVALTAGLALWGALSAPSAVADRPGEARAVVTHTVAPGETLWRVAQSVAAPREDVRDVVDELIVLNGLANGELRAGQQILVPAD